MISPEERLKAFQAENNIFYGHSAWFDVVPAPAEAHYPYQKGRYLPQYLLAFYRGAVAFLFSTISIASRI